MVNDITLNLQQKKILLLLKVPERRQIWVLTDKNFYSAMNDVKEK